MGSHASTMPDCVPVVARSALAYATAAAPWTFDFVPSPPAAAAALKRGLDVAFTIALLLLTSPVLLAAMLVIRLGSRGPVFFVQQRVGLRAAEFSMFKLRTMVANAERLENSMARGEASAFLKVRHDPRITPVGRLLRKLSIDELPQLFNVLRGDMSLVGPRPLLRCDLQNLPPAARARRFLMKPGITGLWQVSGRSDCSDEERVRLDQEYVERWTPWLDLVILARTVPAVLLMRGAS